jgi:SAM-dependent methyltransferase
LGTCCAYAGPYRSSAIDLSDFAEGLQLDPDGIWRGRRTESISYPVAGNETCFGVEDSSFWFGHRNDCLLALLRRYPAKAPFFDIGGGNGFVALAIERAGVPVVLVEPGTNGVCRAQMRGLRNVVHATLKEARFRDGSLPAIGFFDVMEHIEDEEGFLREICRCLAPGGLVYLTVPAGPWLWSDDDVRAGHFRRYTGASLQEALERCGFRALLLGKMFFPLPLPLFLCRALPSLFGRRRLRARSYSGLHRSRLRVLMEMAWVWERNRLARGQGVPWGSSVVAVAELASSAHA